jgi:hypothetical protein
MRRCIPAVFVAVLALQGGAFGQQSRSLESNRVSKNQLVKPTTSVRTETPAWPAFVDSFLADLYKQFPDYARDAGSHAYDHVLLVPDQAQHQQQKAYLDRAEASLKSYPVKTLSLSEKADLAILSDEIKQIKFNREELKAWVWNPASYNVCGAFSEILANTQVPLSQRTSSLFKRIQAVSSFYKAAEFNI